MSKIWPGAFFDRFNPYKLDVLSSADPMIQAAIVDCSVRQYIDLAGKRTELFQLIEYIKGVTGFPLDSVAILDTLPTEDELWGTVETAPAPKEAPLPTGSATVYLIGENFSTVLDGESAPELFDRSWRISALMAALIGEGAHVRVTANGKLEVIGAA